MGAGGGKLEMDITNNLRKSAGKKRDYAWKSQIK